MNTETIKKLKDELADIESKLAAMPKLEQRRRELRGGFGGIGEIGRAVLNKRDAAFPVLCSGGWRKTRIIAVDKKWITTRDDGSEDAQVTRYRSDTGWRERARCGQTAIDAADALAKWESHHQGLRQSTESATAARD